MAMDMPPQQVVEYRMERPILSTEGLMNLIAVAKEMRMKSAKSIETDLAKDMTAKATESVDAGLPSSGVILPKVDVGSAALTQGDRKAMVAGMDARGDGAELKKVSAPASYIGDRVRLAAVRAKAVEDATQGRLRTEEAQAVRCRTIAVAMDRRAGAYVVGGEKAARTARGAIPQTSIEECRKMMGQHVQQTARGQGVRSVTPESARHLGPQRVDIAQSRTNLQRIDPQHSTLQRIDPQASARQRIDPKPTGIPVIDPKQAREAHQRIQMASSAMNR